MSSVNDTSRLWKHVCPTLLLQRRRRHMWVEFVVGSLPCSERLFSGYSGFPSPQKPTFPDSNSTRNQVDEEPLCECATRKSLFYFIYLFLTMIISSLTSPRSVPFLLIVKYLPVIMLFNLTRLVPKDCISNTTKIWQTKKELIRIPNSTYHFTLILARISPPLNERSTSKLSSETRRELEQKYVPQLVLGLLLVTRQLAIGQVFLFPSNSPRCLSERQLASVSFKREVARSRLLGASICAVPLSQPIPVKNYF